MPAVSRSRMNPNHFGYNLVVDLDIDDDDGDDTESTNDPIETE
jgi:hypothetical protein